MNTYGRLVVVVYIVLLSSLSLGEAEMPRVSSGFGHACATFPNGSIYCWGTNFNGELGLGHSKAKYLPARVTLGADKAVSTVATGVTLGSGGFTCAQFEGSSAKCWGSNRDGKLGLGLMDQNIGTVFDETVDKIPYVDLGLGKKVKKIDGSRHHACVLLEDKSLKCFGDNSYGQLGIEDDLSRGLRKKEMGDGLPAVDLGSAKLVSDFCMGHLHTCALIEDGSVKCWGYFAALGNGTTNSVGAKIGDMGENLKPVNLGTGIVAKKLTCSYQHTCALVNNGKVKCWGSNEYAVLGLGTTKDIIGDEANEMGDNLPYVDLGPLAVTFLTSGNHHNCVIVENGGVKCWGDNGSGQLGLGDTRTRGYFISDMGENLPFVNLGRLAIVTQISAGHNFTCIVLKQGQIKCWGKGEYGVLGNGELAKIGTEPSHMGDNLLPLQFR